MLKLLLFFLLFASGIFAQNRIVVFQSDFGLKDGAVSAMKGVAIEADAGLKLFDLTHEIPAFNIWEASYRLEQTVKYWPKGTVFVSVVDPGVGTNRMSVVLKTKTGHYIITPDNGTLTHIALSLGIDSLREIDEAVNRRQNSGGSYTFHGRDVYAYTAARLASGKISFEQVGKELPPKIVTIPFQEATINGNIIKGTIPILDIQYGNVWTNIPDSLFSKLNVPIGGMVRARILFRKKEVMIGVMTYQETFGSVAGGKSLVYLNSLMQVSFAVNEGNFAAKYHIRSGTNGL